MLLAWISCWKNCWVTGDLTAHCCFLQALDRQKRILIPTEELSEHELKLQTRGSGASRNLYRGSSQFNTLRPRQDGRDFADDIFTCILFNEYCCILIKFSLTCVRKGPLTMIQHWFRKWLGADQATSHYLNQWWLVYRHIYASLGLNELSRIGRQLGAHCNKMLLIFLPHTHQFCQYPKIFLWDWMFACCIDLKERITNRCWTQWTLTKLPTFCYICIYVSLKERFCVLFKFDRNLFLFHHWVRWWFGTEHVQNIYYPNSYIDGILSKGPYLPWPWQIRPFWQDTLDISRTMRLYKC